MSIWGPGGRETLVSCISWVRARLSLGLERNKSPSCLCGVTRLQCAHEILIGRKEVDASSLRPYCVWRLFLGLENRGPGGWVGHNLCWRFWVEQSQLQPPSGGPSVDTWCPVWSRDDAPSGPWSGPAPTAPGERSLLTEAGCASWPSRRDAPRLSSVPYPSLSAVSALSQSEYAPACQGG